VRHSSWIQYFDNALKVYHRPPLIIGLAGNAIASDLLATKFQIEHLVPLATREAYARSVDTDWMISRLKNAYSDALRAGAVDQSDEFALVIAVENSMALAANLPSTGNFSGLLNATISNPARAVSRDEREPGQRLVFAMDFLGLRAVEKVRFARGTTRTSRWCAVEHRVIDWVSRSPSRGVRSSNHDRGCDRRDAWVGLSS